MLSPSAIYRNMPWVLLLVSVISAVLLGFFILRVIRLVRQAYITSVPLVEQQDIQFDSAGRVVLCTEGPRFITRFSNLTYELGTRDGARIEGKTVWLGRVSSGVSKVRLAVESYEIPRPGRYVLRIHGLGPGWIADTEHLVVFMKPYLARSIGYVVGVALSAVLLIGSTILFLIRLTEGGAGA
ncbi:MAG: hypothetical protein FJX73_08605 [Armatimonadetes bacterium]|nr:hypothetical protein [Armatimonadota bacterium]